MSALILRGVTAFGILFIAIVLVGLAIACVTVGASKLRKDDEQPRRPIW